MLLSLWLGGAAALRTVGHPPAESSRTAVIGHAPRWTCAVEGSSEAQGQQRGTRAPLATAAQEPQVLPAVQTERSQKRRDAPIVVVGGGVSGVWSALTLHELGYSNVTIIERELRVGGKAASFSYAGKAYPLGAVGTPLALETASFGESQLFERPLRFARSLLGHTGRHLRVLNANNLVEGNSWPHAFPKSELTSRTPVNDWQRAFGASGRAERFYPHTHDFSSQSASLAADDHPHEHLVPRWGHPRTSWPLVYVSAHGYGVAEAADAPPYYYWARFAQKSTNAGAAGPLGMAAPGHNPLGPRGPSLRGWDSSSLFEKKLAAAGVRLRTGTSVSRIERSAESVRVTSTDGRTEEYEQLVLAADLKASLSYLDADPTERELFSAIAHQPYYTVTSFMSLPWLATHSVYYISEHQGPAGGAAAGDAGRATAGCPTIILKPNRGSNLTISWAYGGQGVGAAQIEACLRSTVLRMGGTFGGIHFIKEWADYFPHPPAREMRANFHRRLDALQGQRRTHMVGEIFNLPLVSECVDWARYLIRREFGRAAKPQQAAARMA